MGRWRGVAVLGMGLGWAVTVHAKEEQSVPEPGKPAPVFRLNDHTGKGVGVGPGLSEAWTVLAFFPKSMTPG